MSASGASSKYSGPCKRAPSAPNLFVAPIIGHGPPPDNAPRYGRSIPCPASSVSQSLWHRQLRFRRDGARRRRPLRFSTNAGRISVYLPADMRAGDTMSGTVSVEPAGATPQERQANSDTLEGHVIEIDGRPTLASPNRIIRTTFLAASGATLLQLSRGNDVTRLPPIRCNRLGGAAGGIRSAGTGTGRTPRRDTRPVRRRHEQHPRASWRSESAHYLREPASGRVSAAANTNGPVTLRISEGNTTAQGNFRNIGIALSAPRTGLMRGERTDVTVRWSWVCKGSISPCRSGCRRRPPCSFKAATPRPFRFRQNAGDSNGEWRHRYDLRPDPASPSTSSPPSAHADLAAARTCHTLVVDHHHSVIPDARRAIRDPGPHAQYVAPGSRLSLRSAGMTECRVRELLR